jgi:hypothetical protein
MKGISVLILLAVAIVCTIFPIASQTVANKNAGWLMVDFRAYYCAALVDRQQNDPYRNQPLHACESTNAAPYFRAKPRVTIPAPYPPYALAIIAPFTFLPFGTAAVLWYAFMVLCCVIAAVLLAHVTRLPILVTWAALALSLGLESLPSGQVVPLCIAALIAGALLSQRAQWDLTAVVVGLAMIEPHVALPAAIALFIRYPAARTVLVLFAVLFAAGSLAFGGLERNLEYFGSVLHAHALAEVSRDNQYSLSTVLTSFGVGDEQAVLIGNISYLVMLALGVSVSVRLCERFRDSAFIVLGPPAFAVLGGPFIHSVELVAALPFCLLLYNYTKGFRVTHMVLLTIIVLLAVPWIDATSAALFAAPLFPAAFLIYLLLGDRTSTLVAAVASGFAIVILFIVSARAGTPSHFVNAVHPYINPQLAEYSWRELTLGNSTNRLATWLLRLPTWIALVALVSAACTLVSKTDLEKAVRA